MTPSGSQERVTNGSWGHGVIWLSWGKKSGQPRTRLEAVTICGQPPANAVSSCHPWTLTHQGPPSQPHQEISRHRQVHASPALPLAPGALSGWYHHVKRAEPVSVSRAAMECLWKTELSVNHDVIWENQPSPGCALHVVTTKVPWLWITVVSLMLLLLIGSKRGKRLWGSPNISC